ncbi:trypsin-like serine protease [Streptomyces sp. TLI_105]|uniref:trypsin-like serine protease n=1 Tax=Streptomyces sp. TLI_105 TaxID=1881019 RepID=UPI00089B3B09|nr:trypsin-like serine protease [Streptomyces sp. TLI_105]SEE59245.1 Trypsin [Streptomyces sp. TLI_105]
MPRPRARRYLAASLPSALALTAASLTVAPSSAADSWPAAADGMAYAVEDFSYPDAAAIQAEKAITLKRGDGNLMLQACDGTQDMTVNTRSGLKDYCFDVKTKPAYLSLELPSAYGIWTEAYPVKTTIEADGTKTVIDAPANDFTGYGEATQDRIKSSLIELRVTGESANPPAPSADATLAFTGKITIGEGKRSCTATLVDPRWVITAKHCLADDPADTSTVTAGTPKEKTTLTVGRTDLATSGGHTTAIVELVPHADRDLVMARLAQPAVGLTPVALSRTAPTADAALTVAGFGRTKTDWVPSKVHSAAFSVGTVDTAGFALAAKTPADATICQGDAGAPALRTENGAPALVGLVSRSWQGNCLGSTESRTGAYTTRVDDIASWVEQVRAPRNGSQVSLLAGGGGAMWSQVGNLGYGEYGQSWAKVDGKDVSRVSTVRDGDTVRAYAVAGGRVFGQDLDLASGKWSGWGEVPGGAAGVKDISAALVGTTVYVQIVGSDGNLYAQAADYKAGRWNNTWTAVGASGLSRITSAASGTTVRVQAIGGNGHVFGRDFDTRNGTWSVWGEIPGGAAGAKDISSSVVGNNVHVQIIGSEGALYTQYGNYDAGRWNDTWTTAGGSGLTNITSIASGNAVELYATGTDGKISNADMDTTSGTWSTFRELQGGMSGATDVSAGVFLAPTKVTLGAGAGGTVFTQQAALANGTYNTAWGSIGGSAITSLTSVEINTGIRYVGVAGGKVYDRAYDARTNTWGGWYEIPGGAGGVKDISAAMINNVLYVQALGSDGGLYTQVGDYNAGRWNTGWTAVAGMTGMTNISSAKAGPFVRLYGVAAGKVYGRDYDSRTGGWTVWGELPGGITGAKDIAASVTRHLVHVQVIGADGALHAQTGDYLAGAWKPTWTKIGGTGLTRITSASAVDNIHVYAIGAGGKVQNTTLETTTGYWTNWREIPGTLTSPTDLTATTTK